MDTKTILDLQRTLGNQEVCRILGVRDTTPAESGAAPVDPASEELVPVEGPLLPVPLGWWARMRGTMLGILDRSRSRLGRKPGRERSAD